MKALNLLVGSLSAFAMLTACGEGFKANAIGTSLSERQTTEAEDQEVLNDTVNSTSGLDATLSTALMSDISSGAFEIEIDVSSSRAGDSLNSIKATVQGSDCNKLSVIRNTSITQAEFRSQQINSLGIEGEYEVQAKCNDDVCSEMTASLVRTDGSSKAVVMYGLAAATKTLKANGAGYTQLYVVQPVSIGGYGMASTFADKQSRCNASEFSGTQTAGTGSSVDSTSGSGFTQSEQSSAFGQAPFVPSFSDPSATGPF